MKELETVVQDEKNKWILITGILQVLACVIMNKFDISGSLTPFRMKNSV